MEIFKPKVNMEEKFAVAVPVEGGDVCIVQTYKTRTALASAFSKWQKFASTKGLTLPLAIEIVDETMKCKILKDILEES